jgi:hypothetical protein
VKIARLGSGDQIVAGQSVFRVQVDGLPTHAGEVRSPTGSRIGTALAPSTGCRSPAPAAACSPHPTSTWPATRRGAAGAILWWCEVCRAQVAATPQPVPLYTTLASWAGGAWGSSTRRGTIRPGAWSR